MHGRHEEHSEKEETFSHEILCITKVVVESHSYSINSVTFIGAYKHHIVTGKEKLDE